MLNCLILNILRNFMLITMNFSVEYQACEKTTIGKYFKHDGYLFRENKLCLPNYSSRDLLVRESLGGGLIGHFRVVRLWQFCRNTFIGHIWNEMSRDFVIDVSPVNKPNPKCSPMAYTPCYQYLQCLGLMFWWILY